MRKQFTFGEFTFDVANARLEKNGKEVSLKEKRKNVRPTKMTLAVLFCLLEHHGELVTKDQFFEEVWDDVRGDPTLTFQVKQVHFS